MTSNQVFENCLLEKSHWEINYIVATEYIILAKNQHSIFTFHFFNAKLVRKHSQTPVWQLCDSCQILDLINYQNNLTWPNSNTARISLDSTLKCSKITHRYEKNLPIHLYWKRPTDTDIIHCIYQFHQSCGINARSRVLSWTSCTSARHTGSFDCIITSLILITMDTIRGHCEW